jgi:hypothetical protein
MGDDVLVFVIASLLGMNLGAWRRLSAPAEPTALAVKRYFILAMPFLTLFMFLAWARTHTPESPAYTVIQAVCAFAVGALLERSAADRKSVKPLLWGQVGFALVIGALTLSRVPGVTLVFLAVGAILLHKGIRAWRRLETRPPAARNPELP